MAPDLAARLRQGRAGTVDARLARLRAGAFPGRRGRRRVSALELAERAMRLAGPDALALVTHERSLLLRFAANRPTQATEVEDLTVELAVVRRGHVGRAETNATDDEALAACARRAAAAAA